MHSLYIQHDAICAFPSEEFYRGRLNTDQSVLNRPDNENLDSFWPQGNATPIMFVNVVGDEGFSNEGSSYKVGIDSKFNIKDAKLAVRKHEVGDCCCWKYFYLKSRFG